MSSDLRCNSCGREIPPQHVNIAKDTASCPECGSLARPSDILREKSLGIDDVDFVRPPSGCYMLDSSPTQRIARVSTRSWHGIASSGLGVLLLYGLLVLVVSRLFFGDAEAPKLRREESGFLFDQFVMRAMFLAVIASMFFAGLHMTKLLAMSLGGRIDVEIGGGDGRIFTGVGPFGRSIPFDPARVKRVSVEQTRKSSEDSAAQFSVCIHRTHGLRLAFGEELSEERRAWLAFAIRKLLLDRPRQTAAPATAPLEA
ncbi:MAG: hypothetical protein AAF561_07880 [Planctomycetota bacterium]